MMIVRGDSSKMRDAVALCSEPCCISRMRIISLRRRTLHYAACIAFLLSNVFLTASSSNEPVIVPTIPRKEEEQLINACATPKIFNFNFKPTLQQSVSPRDTPQLGDGQRSMEASGLFFDSIDKDGDGQIEPEEVAMFLTNQIGELKTQQAVDSEVVTVMARLDQNHDNGLGMADMQEYWMQLETLLTAEEVAEWIVYAVQLPPRVGEMFLEHSVTGYDFPEIVENGGKILSDDLGIDKASYRNKIVRQMKVRMLGIGGNPNIPPKFDFKFQSCNAVTLSWERSTGRVFPVHSYRIQRRGINLFGNLQTPENGGITAHGHGAYYSAAIGPNNSDWTTVYVGSDLEFLDSGLETGHNYMYRIQAWNSVGKSGWEIIDLSKALKKQRCSTKPSPKLTAREPVSSTTFQRSIPLDTVEVGWSSLPRRLMWGSIVVVQCVYHFIRGIFGVIAMGAAIMRFRRASASSSSQAAVVLPFVSFWENVNKFAEKWLGRELIPKTMLGDRVSIEMQEQLHDERIMATGLRGYDRLRKKCKADDNVANGHSANREASKNSNRSRSSEDVASPLPKEVVVRRDASPIPKNTFFRRRAQRTRTRSLDSERSNNNVSTDSEVESSERNAVSSVKSGSRKTSRTPPKISRHFTDVEDDTRCIECHKKFQFPKRYKHHCSRCMSTFCHKHGRTTHPNITSCKVPGTCLCNPCLKVLKEKRSQSQRS